MMTYEEARDHIYSIPRFTAKNKPSDTRAFYEMLGSPAADRKIVHVAGTNGKGSVCAYCASVFQAAGYKTAVFTSPHLVSVRERFVYDGEMISREDFTRIFQLVMDYVNLKKLPHPTFFEFLFFMAMLWFEEKKPDVIILETGLGGRLDATNCVPHKALTVITEIGLDHMQYLGDTVTRIAMEKAGILRTDVPCVFAGGNEESGSVIRAHAVNIDAPAYSVDLRAAAGLTFHKNFIDFCYHSRYYGYVRVSLYTCAHYQVQNALLVLAGLDLLADLLPVSREAIEKGLADAKWAGRMEEVRPGVILDGAHNEDGTKAFLASVREDGCVGRRILLYGAVSDKRYEESIRMITESRLFDRVIVTAIDTPRAASAAGLQALFSKAVPCDICESTGQAFDSALSMKQIDDRVYVAGSLYLVGEVKAHLGRHTG